MKGPETWHPMDFVRSFLNSVVRETGTAWEPAEYCMNILKTRMRNAVGVGANPYELVIALDRLAVDWNHYADDGELYAYFDLPYLLQWTRARSRAKDFWRHVYYSRYAVTDDEVYYYRVWLSTWDASEEEGYSHPIWSPMREKAQEKLELAENKVRAENRKPSWKWNAVRDLLTDTFLEDRRDS